MIVNQTAATAVEGQSAVHHGWTASIRSARSLFFSVAAFYVAYLPGVANFQSRLVMPVWYMMMSTWLLTVSNIVNGLLYILLYNYNYKSTKRDFAKMFFSNGFIDNAVSPLSFNSSNQPNN